MRSRTKRDLTGEQVEAMVADAFGAGNALVRNEELTEGSFNTAWLLTLASGEDVVLKVSPRPDAPLLRYEHDIMRTEALFGRLAAGVVPVPEVLHANFDRSIVDGDFVFFSALRGTAWNTVSKQLSTEQRDTLRREIGEIVAKLHTVRGETFGYPQTKIGLCAPDWPTAFGAMFGALLDDAERFGTRLPVTIDRLRTLPEECATDLSEVDYPVLLHFDLWEGNIFLDPSRQRVEGLIDGERALWGDPFAEFVSLSLFADIEEDKAFLAGYGAVEFTPSVRRRIALYRVYLYLIMIIEGKPRGYDSPSQRLARRYYARHLRKALREVDRR